MSDVYPVYHRVDLAPFELRVDSVRKEGITGLVLDIHYAFLRVTRHLHKLDIFGVDDLLDKGTGVGVEVFEAHDVYFVDNQ